MNKKMFFANLLKKIAACLFSIFILFAYVPVYGGEQVDRQGEDYLPFIANNPVPSVPVKNISVSTLSEPEQVFIHSTATEFSEVQLFETISEDQLTRSNAENVFISNNVPEGQAFRLAEESSVEEYLQDPMERLVEINMEDDRGSEDAFCDLVLSEPGNSYVAVVMPENGVKVGSGDTVKLVATITEVGNTTKTGSAQFFIPGLLSVDQSTPVEITNGWAYQWDTVEDGSGFSAILSMWALLSENYLIANESVSASFVVTAAADQEYPFVTKTWQNALIVDGAGVGIGNSINMMAEGYSEPKINVPVSNAAGLNNVRNNLNWHYVQTGYIELSGYEIDGGRLPIGTVSEPFRGSYNGNGFIIDNLAIAQSGKDNIGLFGSIAKSALITTVSLKNADITGRKFVGSLVGLNNGGLIMNSSAAGIVTAEGSNAGGLVGCGNGGAIVDSSADVNITGTRLVGGLIGTNENSGLVSNSSALGSVTGSGQYIGGLVGRNLGIIEGSYALSTVSASSTGDLRAGGLVGDNFGGMVRNSYARGSVSAGGGDYIGGLIGHNANGSVSMSYSEVNVQGKIAVGGLVGYNSSNGLISNSYATGAVFGANGVGGLVGVSDSSVMNSYCTGSVSGIENVGGLVGKKNGGSISASFYLSGQGQTRLGTSINSNQMKTLQTFTNAGWGIVNIDEHDPGLPETVAWYINESAEYPILRWQHVVEPEDPEDPADPDDQEDPGGSGEDDGPDFDSDHGAPDLRFKGWNGYISFSDRSLLSAQQQVAVNPALMRPLIIRIPGSPAGEPLITVDLILSGNHDDYLWALNIYQNSAHYFDLFREKMSEKESIIYLAELLTARAAILAINARLTGEVTALQEAVEAYRMIEQYLTENSQHFFEYQLTAINLVLAALGNLLESLGLAF